MKNGSIEVAATNNVDLDRMAEKGQASWEDFNVLWKSELIPGSPMCVRKDLPESLKAAFAGALMMFNRNVCVFACSVKWLLPSLYGLSFYYAFYCLLLWLFS